MIINRVPGQGKGTMKNALVLFAHGKESGPHGTKIDALGRTAEKLCDWDSINYQDLPNPEDRVKRLLTIIEGHPNYRIILVGSSMGGYVSAVAAMKSAHQIEGLFLMAPAFGMPGYAEPWPEPGVKHVAVVHGWEDTIIPAEMSLRFARDEGADLHLVKDGHRLEEALPTINTIFEAFLQKVIKDEFETFPLIKGE